MRLPLTPSRDGRQTKAWESAFFFDNLRNSIPTHSRRGILDEEGKPVAIERYVEEDLRDWVPPAGRAENLVFERCRFQGTNLVEWATRRCMFDACDFRGARLNSSHHDHSAFLNSSFVGARVFGAAFLQCKMTGSEFSEVNWKGVQVIGGDWSYANLRHADWSGADLSGANLVEVDLSEANLANTNFRGANMTRAILARARMVGADLRDAQIAGIDFSLVSLKDVRLDFSQAALVVASLGAKIE